MLYAVLAGHAFYFKYRFHFRLLQEQYSTLGD
jgi:hypothetical protein